MYPAWNSFSCDFDDFGDHAQFRYNSNDADADADY
jgi:hypothetical protein